MIAPFRIINEFLNKKSIGSYAYFVLLALIFLSVYSITSDLPEQGTYIHKENGRYRLQKGIGFLSSLEGTPKYYNLLSEIRGTTDYFYAVDADKKTTILDNDGNPLSTENRKFDEVFYEPTIHVFFLISNKPPEGIFVNQRNYVGFYDSAKDTLIPEDTSYKLLYPLKYNNEKYYSVYFIGIKGEDKSLTTDIFSYNGDRIIKNAKSITPEGTNTFIKLKDTVNGKTIEYNRNTGKIGDE